MQHVKSAYAMLRKNQFNHHTCQQDTHRQETGKKQEKATVIPGTLRDLGPDWPAFPGWCSPPPPPPYLPSPRAAGTPPPPTHFLSPLLT